MKTHDQHQQAPTIARSVADMRRVLDASRVGFEVRRVRAREAEQWSISDGVLQHRSKGFFSVNGVRFGDESCVLLYQPQSAVTGLLCARFDRECWFLLQARAEPGCLGEAQFGPTVQSTPANYLRLHGGATTPYIDQFISYWPDASLISDTTQLDLGERYLFKSKRSMIIETHVPPTAKRPYVWVTSHALREAVLSSAFLNIDLRSILSVASWGRDGSYGLSPRSTWVRRSLEAPVRARTLGRLLHDLQHRVGHDPRFVPLEDLGNWQRTDWGWSEREPRQGFAVDFFEVKAANREVGQWVQPLVNSSSEGLVILACRQRDGTLECLIRANQERGLATRIALAPSFVRYPGLHDIPPSWLAGPGVHLWSSATESDEGGRFYRDASRYHVIRVDDDGGADDGNGFWLRLSELKLLLAMSNVCTIQLRGVVSYLLGVDDP